MGNILIYSLSWYRDTLKDLLWHQGFKFIGCDLDLKKNQYNILYWANVRYPQGVAGVPCPPLYAIVDH